MAKVVVIYPHGRIEHFSIEDAEYKIRRRLEKEGLEPDEAWVAEPYDFQTVVNRYHNEVYQQELRDQEAVERREYERLKMKFEPREEAP